MSNLFAFRRALGALAAAVVALVASPAAAFTVLSFVNADGTTLTSPICIEAPACTTPSAPCDLPASTMCTELTYSTGTDVLNVCVAELYVRYCCQVPADCPMQGTLTGECVLPPAGDTSFESGLCVYGTVPACLEPGARTAAQILSACFHGITGEGTAPYGTVPWAMGNCDGDSLTNGEEPSSCVCNSDPVCGTVDAGPPADVDGGAPLDAGHNQDAGETPFDAGGVAIDANLPPGAGLDFRGSGGCDAAHTRGASGGSLAGLLALAGVLAVRRRRGARR
jgi:hypothetical protein